MFILQSEKIIASVFIAQIVHCFHLVAVIEYTLFYSSILTTQVTYFMVVLPQGAFQTHSDHYDQYTRGVCFSTSLF